MTISGGIEWVTVQAGLHAWVVACTGLTSAQVAWGDQPMPRLAAPAVSMRLILFEDKAGWLTQEPNPLVVADLVFTASGALLTKTAHTLVTGDGPFRLTTTGTLPGALALATDYWAVRLSADTFSLADTFEHAIAASPTVITTTTAGTGAHTLSDTDDTLRAGEEITYLSQGTVRATLQLECHTTAAVGIDMACAVLRRIPSRSVFPNQEEILDAANVGLIDFGPVRAIKGTKDAVLFEPRALLDVHINLASEESDTGGIIARTVITDLGTGLITYVPPY